jgi:hypothetical protein
MVKYTYVATAGTGLNTINLQNELGKLCDFRSLTPGKAAARLSHLPSEARNCFHIKVGDIQWIPEMGHEGCGFAPDCFFERFRLKGDAIQMRAVGARCGLLKGVLVQKRGISHIQIPSSMIKAGPSIKTKNDYLTIILKKEYPSVNNLDLGRYMDPEKKDPRKSWKNGWEKELSAMYVRILVGFGVPKKIVCKSV